MFTFSIMALQEAVMRPYSRVKIKRVEVQSVRI